MDFNFPESWRSNLGDAWTHTSLDPLRDFLKSEYATRTVYPATGDVFNAMALTPPADARVLILGQDPYHGAGQAHGLSFSIRPGVRIPPSLRNIFKELHDDLGVPLPDHGDLTAWAAQGVLLLNAVLTVRGGTAGAHAGHG